MLRKCWLRRQIMDAGPISPGCIFRSNLLETNGLRCMQGMKANIDPRWSSREVLVGSLRMDLLQLEFSGITACLLVLRSSPTNLLPTPPGSSRPEASRWKLGASWKWKARVEQRPEVHFCGLATGLISLAGCWLKLQQERGCINVTKQEL